MTFLPSVEETLETMWIRHMPGPRRNQKASCCPVERVSLLHSIDIAEAASTFAAAVENKTSSADLLLDAPVEACKSV